MARWILVSLLILFFLVFVPINQGQEKRLDSAELYDVAMELYYQGRYEESIDRFATLIRTYPTSQSVPYATYMLGQCYFRMGRSKEAITQFELYLNRYPEGDRRTEAGEGLQKAREGQKGTARFSFPSPRSFPCDQDEAAHLCPGVLSERGGIWARWTRGFVR